MNEEDYFAQLDDSFLDQAPKLPPLPELQGEKIVLDELAQILGESPEPAPGNFLRVVGVRFGNFGRVHSYDAGSLKLRRGDSVVVEVAEKGLMLGEVAQAPIWMDNSQVKARLKKLERAATAEDKGRHERALEMAQRGREMAQQHISRMNLKMTILELEYTLDLRKALLYFSSEDRIDFRGLLRELTHDLKAKVELRQVGVRDQAKLSGGIGPCGEELCCSKHLNRFHGVNIRMAKDQGLSLKPTRVSGLCGRLKCCLQYEADLYRKFSKGLPHVGKSVKCNKGCGVVSDVDVLSQKVVVVLEDGQVVKVDLSDIIDEKKKGFKNERVVATTDTDVLLEQLASSSEQQECGEH